MANPQRKSELITLLGHSVAEACHRAIDAANESCQAGPVIVSRLLLGQESQSAGLVGRLRTKVLIDEEGCFADCLKGSRRTLDGPAGRANSRAEGERWER